MRGHAFLEKIQAAKAAAEAATSEAATEAPKSAEQMTGEELEEAITASRRKLLDAQHAELRERELARVSPSESSPEGVRLAGVLQELQRKKRRNWR
jgi:hypothetical protein